MAYNNLSIRVKQSFPYCGLLPPPFRTIVMQNCNSLDTALIVCDVTNSSQLDENPLTVIATTNSPLRNGTNQENFVTCPKGHMTHGFLSCDVLSSCQAVEGTLRVVSTELAWDVPPPSSCTTATQPAPPYFSCSNGVQHVPYTLMCNHHDDCQDGGDERFCRFPDCTVDQLPCGGSQQVGLHRRPAALWREPAGRSAP